MPLTDISKQIILSTLDDVLGGKIQGVVLYGSQATGTATSTSDIDLAVLLNPDAEFSPETFWDLGQEVARKLMIDVDLVDLRAATTVLQKEIVVDGLWLRKDDEFACDLFETHVISMYQQLQYDRKEILEDIISRVRNG